MKVPGGACTPLTICVKRRASHKQALTGTLHAAKDEEKPCRAGHCGHDNHGRSKAKSLKGHCQLPEANLSKIYQRTKPVSRTNALKNKCSQEHVEKN